MNLSSIPLPSVSGHSSKSLPRGLDSVAVEAQRKKFGANILTPPKRDPWWRQFLEKFDDPVIRILMIAAFIAIVAGGFHGEFLEGIGIIVAILLATGLAFFNEFKANREFDILNKVNDDFAFKVIRNGGYTTIPMKDIVVGDNVFIETGEEVPADGSLFEAIGLQISESSLTGETEPNGKIVLGESIGSRPNATIPAHLVMRGTMVVDGYGLYEVTAVGDSTELGRTARAGVEDTGEVTPLNQQLEKLSKIIGVVGLAVAFATFAALVVRGAAVGELTLTFGQWYVVCFIGAGVSLATVLVWLPMLFDGLELVGGWLGLEVASPAFLCGSGEKTIRPWLFWGGLGFLVIIVGTVSGILAGIVPFAVGEWLPGGAAAEFLNYFMIAVTIIVVAVPEGLAMSVTLSLAYSMRKMTASNTLVRKMDACETIGATTVICSDKTGTLTMNEMRVFDTNIPALGPMSHKLAESDPTAKLVSEALAVNSTAHLDCNDPSKPLPLGNPTEGALLLWLNRQEVDYVVARSSFKVSYQLTFSAERKFMATLGESPAFGKVLHVKGAPEIILARCNQILMPGGAETIEPQKESILASLVDFQSRGMRTLGLAFTKEPIESEKTDLEKSICNLTWLGFVAISDPIRPEVPEAVRACKEAGIRVKIVTGDNPETAREIARQAGLCESAQGTSGHWSGPDFACLDDAKAEEASAKLDILSRARPMDKVRLVRSLQARGEIVAVTGDGINDCGALNHANVGLAMGKTGKAAAKEASDIILLDDSFGTIIHAVMWGRSLYENIQRFIFFQLTINVAALGVALLGPFLGVKLPLTVIQMLWVNLIMDTFAALALATEPPHRDVMRRPPRDSSAFIISKGMAVGIFGIGLVFLLVLLCGLLWIQRDGIVTDYELSMFFAVFVMLQFWNLFNARSLGLKKSVFTNFFGNSALLAIAAVIFLGTILLVQFGGSLFRTVPLSIADWLTIIVGTSAVLWIGEVYRFALRRKEQTLSGSPMK